MSRPDALRLLHVGEIRVDGGIRSDGLRLLAEKENVVGGYIRRIGVAVPTICKDCAGTGDVECGGCHRGNRTDRLGDS